MAPWFRTPLQTTDGQVFAISDATASLGASPAAHADGAYGPRYLASLGLPLQPLDVPLCDPGEAGREADRRAIRRLAGQTRFALESG